MVALVLSCCVESESLNDERGRDPAKSLERESNPPSQSKFRMMKIAVLRRHVFVVCIAKRLQSVLRAIP